MVLTASVVAAGRCAAARGAPTRHRAGSRSSRGGRRGRRTHGGGVGDGHVDDLGRRRGDVDEHASESVELGLQLDGRSERRPHVPGRGPASRHRRRPPSPARTRRRNEAGTAASTARPGAGPGARGPSPADPGSRAPPAPQARRRATGAGRARARCRPPATRRPGPYHHRRRDPFGHGDGDAVGPVPRHGGVGHPGQRLDPGRHLSRDSTSTSGCPVEAHGGHHAADAGVDGPDHRDVPGGQHRRVQTRAQARRQPPATHQLPTIRPPPAAGGGPRCAGHLLPPFAGSGGRWPTGSDRPTARGAMSCVVIRTCAS